MLARTSSTRAPRPNQQLIPAAEYLMSKEGGGYKKFYLLGTDYVFPRTANKILRAFLLAKGVPDGEHRGGVHAVQPSGLPDDRRQDQALRLRRQRRRALDDQRRLATCPSTRSSPTRACAARTRPIMAFSVAEDELRGMDTSALVGHLAAWNYYQSVDTPQNKKFVNGVQGVRARRPTCPAATSA